jgi:hypothetical protein
MGKKAAFFDFHRDDESDTQTSDQTVETDYTLVASCVVADKSKDAEKRKIKAEQVRQYIAGEKNQPLSMVQKFRNLISSK